MEHTRAHHKTHSSARFDCIRWLFFCAGKLFGVKCLYIYIFFFVVVLSFFFLFCYLKILGGFFLKINECGNLISLFWIISMLLLEIGTWIWVFTVNSSFFYLYLGRFWIWLTKIESRSLEKTVRLRIFCRIWIFNLLFVVIFFHLLMELL